MFQILIPDHKPLSSKNSCWKMEKTQRETLFETDSCFLHAEGQNCGFSLGLEAMEEASEKIFIYILRQNIFLF